MSSLVRPTSDSARVEEAEITFDHGSTRIVELPDQPEETISLQPQGQS